MLRRLIQQGTGGYVVYLPKHWILGNGLRKGDSISIRESGNNLLIEVPKEKKRTVEVAVTKKNRHDIRNILTHYYRMGVNTIVFSGVRSEEKKSIQQETKNCLLGFEVTESEGTCCTVSGVSEPDAEQYGVILRRLFLLIKETHNFVSDDMLSGAYTNQEDIVAHKTQHDNMILFCRRVLSQGKLPHDALTMWELLTFLMHIEHAYVYMHDFARQRRVRLGPKHRALLSALASYFDTYYKAFFSRDIACVHEINEKKHRLQFGLCYEALTASRGNETVVLSLIRELFRLIQIGSSPLFVQLLAMGGNPLQSTPANA